MSLAITMSVVAVVSFALGCIWGRKWAEPVHWVVEVYEEIPTIENDDDDSDAWKRGT